MLPTVQSAQLRMPLVFFVLVAVYLCLLARLLIAELEVVAWGVGRACFLLCFFFLSDGGGEATVWEKLVIRRAE